MFSTIDLNTHHFKHRSNPKSFAAIRKEKPVQRRSKTGCLTCRKRKKKCDEARPVCVFCQKRGLSCDWEIKNYNLENWSYTNEEQITRDFPTSIDKMEINKLEEIFTDSERSTSSLTSVDEHSTLASRALLELSTSPSKALLELSTSPISHFKSTFVETEGDVPSNSLTTTGSPFSDFNKDFYLDDFNYTAILSQPSSTFNLFLDDAGLVYLNYFENNVANLLSVSPRSSNYFLKTFFSLAITNESISNALAAWGALFMNDNPDLQIVNHYLKKSKDLANTSLSNKYDYFVTLAYYLINIGIQICSGDTKNWHTIFNKCCDLLGKYGGVKKFIRDFDHSNDTKFLVANFQFHDVMSSETLTNGTRCLLSNYSDIFESNKADEEVYGIDPYQGCIQPIVLLLGEIMNVYAKLKGEGNSIKERLESKIEDLDAYNKERMEHYAAMSQAYDELKNKVKYCKPVNSQLEQLSEGDKVKHHKLFELYRMTCKMYLSIYFRQSLPISSEVQILLLNSCKIMDELVDTNLKGSFNMSLLICGISCCNDIDRNVLDSKFQQIYKNYKVGNVKRIWDIVRESWRRNANGGMCIDWIDICNDFGWKLSLC